MEYPSITDATINGRPLADDAEFKKIAEPFGGAEVLYRKIIRGHLAAQRLGREWPALMELHPDQWVAMDADGLAAVAATEDALLTALDDKGISGADVIIEFLETTPKALIL